MSSSLSEVSCLELGRKEKVTWGKKRATCPGTHEGTSEVLGRGQQNGCIYKKTYMTVRTKCRKTKQNQKGNNSPIRVQGFQIRLFLLDQAGVRGSRW